MLKTLGCSKLVQCLKLISKLLVTDMSIFFLAFPIIYVSFANTYLDVCGLWRMAWQGSKTAWMMLWKVEQWVVRPFNQLTESQTEKALFPGENHVSCSTPDWPVHSGQMKSSDAIQWGQWTAVLRGGPVLTWSYSECLRDGGSWTAQG